MCNDSACEMYRAMSENNGGDGKCRSPYCLCDNGDCHTAIEGAKA